MPLALLLLLKLRLKYDFTFDDPKADVWLAISLRTADACITNLLENACSGVTVQGCQIRT
jgi:hypothetical protein